MEDPSIGDVVHDEIRKSVVDVKELQLRTVPYMFAVSPKKASIKANTTTDATSFPHHRSRSRAISLSHAASQEVLQIAGLLGRRESTRVLVVEPFSYSLAQYLVSAGFPGELRALSQHSFPQTKGQHVYCEVVISDWIADLSKQMSSASLYSIGQFDVIVALELSRFIPCRNLAGTLECLAGLLAPQGYLISGEPEALLSLAELEPLLLDTGLLRTADEQIIDADWTWRINRWQRRLNPPAQQSGIFSLITGTDMERDVRLRESLVSCFREVFGDREWGEWMYCLSCDKRYSRQDYEALSPQDQCVCGARSSFVVYHTPERVLSQLCQDLAVPENSHLYVRYGLENEVDAFVWGSLRTAKEIAADLLPHHGRLEQKRLQTILASQLKQFGITDRSALIYHQEFIGALETVRSFSLVRTLFARMCQFALDRGIEYVVSATVPTVNAYRLLRGTGMEVVYTYPPLDTSVKMASTQSSEAIGPETTMSSSLRSALDERGVILGGPLQSVLQQMSFQSDRAQISQVLRYMKQDNKTDTSSHQGR